MEDKGENENEGQAGDADDHGHADLRQRAEAQRGKEFRPRFIADREDEQAEEDRLEQRRDHESSELSKEHGHDQRAGRGADRKSLDLEPPEERSKRDGEQQEDFRRGRNDPSDCVHWSRSSASCWQGRICASSVSLIQINPPRPALFEGRGLRWSPISSRKCRLRDIALDRLAALRATRGSVAS